MARRLPSPQDFADRWVSGMNRTETSTKYKAGVSNLDFDPLVRAADARDAYLTGCQEGNAKREARLRNYGKDNWVASCVNKGAGRLGSGATASKARMVAAGARLLPMISNVLAALPAGGSYEKRRERAAAYSEMMHQAARS